MEKIAIVDIENLIIGSKAKDTITPKDIYQVASLWIENDNGEVLLAQRSFSKKHHPWKWWPVVEWTLEVWETYESKVLQRSLEEIGLKLNNSDISIGRKIHISSPYNHFNQTFKLKEKYDIHIESLSINTQEIEGVKWWNKDILRIEIQNNPENFVTLLELFL